MVSGMVMSATTRYVQMEFFGPARPAIERMVRFLDEHVRG